MKRFHVHVAVPDLGKSIGFYSTLFGAQPSVRKRDYAKWILDEPRLNFAISQRGGRAGIEHLGFQVDSDAELASLHAQISAAGRGVTAEKDAHCCYARSDKYWVTDPAGVAWEAFHTLDPAAAHDADTAEETCEAGNICCAAGSSVGRDGQADRKA